MAIMDLGLSHEVISATVMSKEDAMFGFMGEFTIRAYDILMNAGMKVTSKRLGNCWIHSTLGYEVTSVSTSTMHIKNWNAKGQSKLVELINWKLCHLVAWRLLLFRMEADSSSAIAPVPSSVDKKFKEVKQETNSLQSQVNAIDYEGSRCLDHVNKDLVFLRKKINRKAKRTENSLTMQIVELELKVDKLALKFVKHEENGMSSSSEG